MSWTETARVQYARAGLRYQSDAYDAEWAVIAPFLPAPRPLGRPREVDLRDVVDAIPYIARTGCQWRFPPKDFPPSSAVQRYFHRRRDDGTWEGINHALAMQAREKAGREASPTAGTIDGQSVKTTESGGPRGHDAGRKIKGRKRHILTDTLGFPVGLLVRTADIQDRDGAAQIGRAHV